jgi:hypothetical protein
MGDIHGFISISEKGNAIIVGILACVGQEMLLIHVWSYVDGRHRLFEFFSEESSPETDTKTKVRDRFLGGIYRKLMQLLAFKLACFYSPSTPSSGRKCARATNHIGGPIKRAANYKDHQEGDQ